jgi:probable O-glycosylation ligase (exosortase A-associated)
MKQLLFMMTMLSLGWIGAIYHPFWGVMLYYGFAVLRPQYMWKWTLPDGMRWSLMAAAAAVMGAVLNFNKLVEPRTFNKVFALMIVYGVLLMGSVLTAHEPGLAMAWGVEYAKVLFMALLACMVIREVWQLRAMTAMILVFVGYVAWEINSLYLFDNRLDIFHHGFGGLDNNGAGLMIAMGVPIAYAYGISAPKRWQRIVAWLLALFMLHAVLMSYSRGAMLSLGLAVIWTLWHHRPRKHAAVMAAVLVMVVSVLAGQEIRERFSSTVDFEADASANSRFDSWAAGWAIATDHPILGQGIRNSNIYTANYGADRRGRTIHSNYIQIAADSGIPALCVYLALLGVAFVNLRSTRLAAGEYLDECRDRDPLREPDEQMKQMYFISIGCQGSLFIFAFGSIFLSLEMFELPWLLIVLAGAMPDALARDVDRMRSEPYPQTAVTPRPHKALRRRPKYGAAFARQGVI